jgi:hypothetical protein
MRRAEAEATDKGWAHRTILWRGSWWWAFDDRFSAGRPARPAFNSSSSSSLALDRTVQGMCPRDSQFTHISVTRQKSFKTAAVMLMARFLLLICEGDSRLLTHRKRVFQPPQLLIVKLQVLKKTDGSYFFSLY